VIDVSPVRPIGCFFAFAVVESFGCGERSSCPFAASKGKRTRQRIKARFTDPPNDPHKNSNGFFNIISVFLKCL
jgi:hypothetical protein